MATISSLFERLQAHNDLREALNVRVVVELAEPPRSIGARAETALRDQTAAFAMIETVGIGANSLKDIGVRPRHVRPGDSSVILDIPLRSLATLGLQPGVNSIRPARFHTTFMDSVPNMIGVRNMVDSQLTGSGVTVAVIDSGIDHNHPDLAGRVELALSRNFTDEGNGDHDVSDLNGHGTHVAGIIGGAGEVYRGIAPGVRFIACKVFDSRGRGDEGAVIDAVAWAIDQNVDIINYSGGYGPVFAGVPAVRPPWVWPQNEMEEERAFRLGAERGIVSVVSAGNFGYFGRGTITMPATCEQVIAVGSIGKNGRPSSFSSIGPVYRSPAVSLMDTVQAFEEIVEKPSMFRKPNLIAPGGEVTPFLARLGGCYYEDGIVSCESTMIDDTLKAERMACRILPHYVKSSGTSQAAPVISGLAALILEAFNSGGAERTVQRQRAVRYILKSASQGLTPKAPENVVGAGLPAWPEIERLIRRFRSGKTSLAQMAR